MQQSPLPTTLSTQTDPADLLESVYGLRSADVALLRSARTASEGSATWKRAEQLVHSVFHKEIDRVYAKLNAHVPARFAKLGERIATTVHGVTADGQELGMSLPDPRSLVPQASPISRPADDRPFRTRAGKDQVMRVEIDSVASQIDTAMAPVRAVHQALTASATKLDDSIAKIKAALDPIEERIRKLEEQIGKADKQLTQLSIPFTWIPVEPRMFVQFYPTLFAALFMLSTLRYVRLARLRARLRTRLEERGLSKEHLGLALSVPDATIDLPDHPGSRAGLVALITIALFLIGIAWRVAASPAFEPKSVVLLNVPAIVLIATTVFYATRRTH